MGAWLARARADAAAGAAAVVAAAAAAASPDAFAADAADAASSASALAHAAAAAEALAAFGWLRHAPDDLSRMVRPLVRLISSAFLIAPYCLMALLGLSLLI